MRPKRNTTTVSIKADRDYIEVLNILARNKGVTTAQVVRDAIDRVHGEDIQNMLPVFRAMIGTKTNQSLQKSSN
jgi:predicted DNA-binding protein